MYEFILHVFLRPPGVSWKGELFYHWGCWSVSYTKTIHDTHLCNGAPPIKDGFLAICLVVFLFLCDARALNPFWLMLHISKLVLCSIFVIHELWESDEALRAIGRVDRIMTFSNWTAVYGN